MSEKAETVYGRGAHARVISMTSLLRELKHAKAVRIKASYSDDSWSYDASAAHALDQSQIAAKVFNDSCTFKRELRNIRRVIEIVPIELTTLLNDEACVAIVSDDLKIYAMLQHPCAANLTKVRFGNVQWLMRLGRELLTTVAALQRHRAAHMDIHPGNVVFCKHGNNAGVVFKLVDWESLWPPRGSTPGSVSKRRPPYHAWAASPAVWRSDEHPGNFREVVRAWTRSKNAFDALMLFLEPVIAEIKAIPASQITVYHYDLWGVGLTLAIKLHDSRLRDPALMSLIRLIMTSNDETAVSRFLAALRVRYVRPASALRRVSSDAAWILRRSPDRYGQRATL